MSHINDEQIEKLKVIYENSREHYSEATFKQPARVVDRGFRWSTIYVIALGSLPTFLQTIFETLLDHWRRGYFSLALIEGLLAVTTVIFLIIAIRELLRTIRYREYDWIDLEELPSIIGSMPLNEFYSTLTERILLASLNNVRTAQLGAQRLTRSNQWFYWALFIGLAVYLFCKLQLTIS